jgi:hypothetical protein
MSNFIAKKVVDEVSIPAEKISDQAARSLLAGTPTKAKKRQKRRVLV